MISKRRGDNPFVSPPSRRTSNSFAAAIDDPIVPIERQVVAEPVTNFRSRRKIFRFAAERGETRRRTLAAVHRFPFQHFVPGEFVVQIVRSNDIFHIRRFQRVLFPSPPFAQHRVPKHLRRRINLQQRLSIGRTDEFLLPNSRLFPPLSEYST